ncbi:MAG: hypothetical protein IPK79_11325 [Vampirovibrionales bacterium]|nr:hypothetical protein [Vampirovibrionales bacterium]
MTSRRTPFVSTAKTVSAAAESAIDWPFLEEARPKSGLWERLKSALEEMVFEDDDRPIGMTQLARNTFAPAEANQTSVFFRNAPTFSDYGFIKRYQENPAHGAFQRSAANARSSR